MQPKIELYDKDGYIKLAQLPNCTNVQVEQDLDGQYELTFDYYYKDERYKKITKGRTIRLVENEGPLHSTLNTYDPAEVYPIKQYDLTGTHDGGNNSSTLVDSGTNFVEQGIKVGMIVHNSTDGCKGVISGIRSDTGTNDELLFEDLTGGAGDDFDTGDSYYIRHNCVTLATSDWNTYNLGDYVWIAEDFSTVSMSTSNTETASANVKIEVNNTTNVSVGQWLRIEDGNNAENIKVLSYSAGNYIRASIGNSYSSGATIEGPVRKHCARVLAKWIDNVHYLGLSRLHFNDTSTIKKVQWRTFKVNNISESRDGISVSCKHIGQLLDNHALSRHGTYNLSYSTQGEGIVGQGELSLYEYLYELLSYNQINFDNYDSWTPVNGLDSFLPGCVLNFEYNNGSVSCDNDSELDLTEPVDYEDEWKYLGPGATISVEGQNMLFTGQYINVTSLAYVLDSNPGTITNKDYLIRGISSYTGDSYSTGTIDNVTSTSYQLDGNNTAIATNQYYLYAHHGMVIKLQDDFHSYHVNQIMVDTSGNDDDDFYITEYPRTASGSGLSYELKTDRRPASFNNDSVFTGLLKICELFRDNYHKVWLQVNEDKTVDIRCKLLPDPLNPTSDYTVQYAHNLENITRQHEDIDYYNRVIPQGSSSDWVNAESGERYNLDSNFKKDSTELLLPAAQTESLDSTNQPQWSYSGNGYLRYGDPVTIYEEPVEYTISSVDSDYEFTMTTELSPVEITGALMYITTGQGKGQVARIVSNTSIQVTILQRFDVRPDANDKVLIAKDTHHAHIEGFGVYEFKHGPNFGVCTGSHTGANNDTDLVDTNADFVNDGVQPDYRVYNTTKDNTWGTYADVNVLTDANNLDLVNWTNSGDMDTDDNYVVQGHDYFEVNYSSSAHHIQCTGTADNANSSATVLVDSAGRSFVELDVDDGDIVYDLDDTGKQTKYYAWGVVDEIVDGPATNNDQINLVSALVDGDDNDFSAGTDDHHYAIVKAEYSLANSYTGGLLTVTRGTGKTQSFIIEHNDDFRFYVGTIDIIPDATTQFRVVAPPRMLETSKPIYLATSPTTHMYLPRQYRSGYWTEELSGKICGAVDNSTVNNKTTSATCTGVNFVTQGAEVGNIFYNETDGSFGVITSITTTTDPYDTVNFSGGLTQGTDNDVDNGDTFHIYRYKSEGHFIITNDDDNFDYRKISTQVANSTNSTISSATGTILVTDVDMFTEDMVGYFVQNTNLSEYRVITGYTSEHEVTLHYSVTGWSAGENVQVYTTDVQPANSFEQPPAESEVMLVKEHHLPISLPDKLDFVPDSSDDFVLLLKQSSGPLTIGKHLRFRDRVLAAGCNNHVYIAVDDASAYDGPFEPGQLIFIGAKELSQAYELNSWRGDQINGHVYEIDYISYNMSDTGGTDSNPTYGAIGNSNSSWVETVQGLYNANNGTEIEYITLHLKEQFKTVPQPGDWIEILSLQDYDKMLTDDIVSTPVSFSNVNNPLELYDRGLSDLEEHTVQRYKYNLDYIDKEKVLELGQTVAIDDNELGIDVNDQYISKLSWNPYNLVETELDLTNPRWYNITDKINDIDSRVYNLETQSSTEYARCIHWDQNNKRCLEGLLLCEGSRGHRDGKKLSNDQPITKTNCRGYKPMNTRYLGGNSANIQIEELEVVVPTSANGYSNAESVPLNTDFTLKPESRAIVTGFYYQTTSSVPVNAEPSCAIVRDTNIVAESTVASGGNTWLEDSSLSDSSAIEEGQVVHNIDDGSYGTITSVETLEDGNLRLEVTDLTGGTQNDFDVGENYEVIYESDSITSYRSNRGCTIKYWYTLTSGSLSENAIMRITVFALGRID